MIVAWHPTIVHGARGALEVLLVVEEPSTTGSTLLVVVVAALVENMGEHLRAAEEDTDVSPACRGTGREGVGEVAYEE